jgi:hypothetical protein
MASDSMTLPDIFSTIRHVFDTIQPSAPIPPPVPVFTAIVSELEPGIAQLTFVASLFRADGHTGSSHSHLDVRLARADAAEIAFALRRAATQLDDFLEGRCITHPGRGDQP